MTPELYQAVLFILGLIALIRIIYCIRYFRRRRLQRRQLVARLDAYFNEAPAGPGNPDLPRNEAPPAPSPAPREN